MSYSPIDPYLNQPQANSQRSPRAIVTINGIQAKWIEIEITTNHFYVSDTFIIDLPLMGQPKELNFQYWALCGLFEIKVYIGFPPNPESYSNQDLPLFMTGNLTDFTLDPVKQTVRIHGRDLSSRLIDRKLTQTYNNLTLSQIAEQMAFQNNLTPDVENTTEKVGIFYKNNLTVLSNNSTQWDLLTGLAQLQNFVVYVNNETLVCIEREAVQNSRTPYVLNYQSSNNQDLITNINNMTTGGGVNSANSSIFPKFNGMSLNLSRTPYSDIYVTIVVPYGFQSKRFISVTKIATNPQRTSSGLPQAAPRRFVHKYFGLTRQQAELKAIQLLNSYVIHEFELTATLPGDNILLKDSLIQLTGTNSAFDQNYYPDEITRRISMDEDETGGYYMSVNAKVQSSPTEFV